MSAMLTIDRGDICDAECKSCSNGGAQLCRRWSWLLDGRAQVARPLVDGRLCPSCGHVIALRTFAFCPYCGQAFEGRTR